MAIIHKKKHKFDDKYCFTQNQKKDISFETR